MAAALGQLTALTGATGAKGGGKRKGDGEDGLKAEDSVMGRIQEYGLKAGPGNSVIWDYFEKYNVANDSPLRSIGVCKLCRQQDDYAKVRCLCAVVVRQDSHTLRGRPGARPAPACAAPTDCGRVRCPGTRVRAPARAAATRARPGAACAGSWRPSSP